MTVMSNEWHNIYNQKRYRDRMDMALEILGGKCVRCYSTADLELDHIDPSTKEFDIAKEYGTNIDRFIAEVRKCQILCKLCHSKKTVLENGHILAENTHGTLSSYRYCKCDLCKLAKKEYMQEYMKHHLRKRDRDKLQTVA